MSQAPETLLPDALSREPFDQSCVSYRIVTEPYMSLLRAVSGVVDDTVQNAFRYSNNHQIVLRSRKNPQNTSANESSDTGSVGTRDVSAVLEAHSSGGLSEVMGASPAVPQLQQVDSPIPHSSLVNQQVHDCTISRVLYYIDRRRNPSKNERTDEPPSVHQLLKYWDRLVIHDGLLEFMIQLVIKGRVERCLWLDRDSSGLA